VFRPSPPFWDAGCRRFRYSVAALSLLQWPSFRCFVRWLAAKARNLGIMLLSHKMKWWLIESGADRWRARLSKSPARASYVKLKVESFEISEVTFFGSLLTYLAQPWIDLCCLTSSLSFL
jgi:hypothetical protein